MNKFLLTTLAMLAAVSGVALAQSKLTQEGAPDPKPTLPTYRKTAAEWQAIAPTGGAGSSGSAKVQVVNLLGDPSKPGVYAQLLKVAPHAVIQAHHHAGDRVANVLRGTWMFGYGSTFDRARLKVLPAGSVYTEPSGASHFAATGDQAVVVEVTGFGPTDTVYENPANDPTKKNAAN